MRIVKGLLLFVLYNLKTSGTFIISSDITNFSISNSDSKEELSQNSRKDTFPIKPIDGKFESVSISNSDKIIFTNDSLKSNFTISPLTKLSEYECDTSHTREIHEALDEICKNDPVNSNGIFPKELVKLIGGYERSIPIQIARDNVMNKLDPLGESRKELDIDNDDFLKNLYSKVKEKEGEFPIKDIFWTDLAGLLVEIIFALKRKMINDSNSKFEKVSEIIQSIDSIITVKYYPVILPTFNFKFNLKTMEIDNLDSDFLKFEFFEHSDRISSIFAAALEYAYIFPFIHNKEKDEKWEISEFDCKKFKMKFFENGNPETDMPLKLFMIRHDDKGELIRNCLGYDIQQSHSITITKELIKKIKVDIDGLKSKGVEHFIDIPRILYANSSIMNFIWSNKRKVLIKSAPDLYWLLKRMKETNLLNRKNVETIAEFEEDENKWNQNTFEEYLREYEKDFYDYIERVKFINEFLELFRLEPLNN